jgi:hypothetical protein
MPPGTSFDLPVVAFVAIPILLVCLLTWGVRAASTPRQAALVGCAAAAWMALTVMVAATGVLRGWDRNPPPLMFLIAAILALAVSLAFSSLGGQLTAAIPLWVLVAVQAFRLPLELAMHAMSQRGVMPSVMSYTGRNFDIVTGASAILVAALAAFGIGGRLVVWVWNVMGFGLLLNIIGVALLATPRFRYFGDSQLNIWITYPPFVWLPAVMVLAALAGHLLIFRALLRREV